jgi:phage tail sheath protein FI
VNIYVLVGGIIKERFSNVSMTDSDARYVEKVINDVDSGSDYVKVTDVDAAVPSPLDLPATGTFGPLTGGNDGLTSLADTDFIGGESTNGSTGFRALDTVDIDVLIAPGKATSAIHNAMVTYAEITRAGLLFCVFDPPANTNAAGIITYVKSTAGLYQLSEFAAMYWPRIKVINPSTTLYGADKTLVVPPSGMVAGVYARVDAARIAGACDHPAGTDSLYLPKNVLGLETNEVLKKPKRDLVVAALVNPISQETGPIFIDGARCLKDNGNWPTIGQRRGVIFIEKKLIPGLSFIRHRNINAKLFASGQATVELFMNEVTSSGLLASSVPSKAYYIDFGPAVNTASTAKQRVVYANFGVAMANPAEFVVLRISPDTRALDEELIAAAA